MSTILLNGNITVRQSKAIFVQVPFTYMVVAHTDSTHAGMNMQWKLACFQSVSFLVLKFKRVFYKEMF